MEEEYRVVNGIKLPPKRRIVIKSGGTKITSKTPPPDPLLNTVNVRGEQSSLLDSSAPSLPFGSIRHVIFELKEKCESDDIFFPEQEKFPQKWAALSKRILTSMGKTPRRQEAIALFDCTILGGCEYGALIDKSGIYTVNEDRELDGYLDWMSFAEKADIVSTNNYEIKICSQPNVALDIARFDVKKNKVVELFAAILDIVSGGKAKRSQVHPVSRCDRVKNFLTRGVCFLISLAMLGLGYWGLKCYAHVQNVKKAFTEMCESSPYWEKELGYQSVLSVDVPQWDWEEMYYSCSAKVRVARNEVPEETLDVTFTAQRIPFGGSDRVGVNLMIGYNTLKNSRTDETRAAIERVGNVGFWEWIGDYYHIQDVKVKR